MGIWWTAGASISQPVLQFLKFWPVGCKRKWCMHMPGERAACLRRYLLFLCLERSCQVQPWGCGVPTGKAGQRRSRTVVLRWAHGQRTMWMCTLLFPSFLPFLPFVSWSPARLLQVAQPNLKPVGTGAHPQRANFSLMRRSVESGWMEDISATDPKEE